MSDLDELHGLFYEDLRLGQTAAYARTATQALTNVTQRYIELIADHGVPEAFRRDANLLGGLNLMNGRVCHPAVANAHQLPLLEPGEVLSL